MAERGERVIAIDVGPAVVRGIVLANGQRAVAGGYAQLGYGVSSTPLRAAARISAALDPESSVRVAVTFDDSLGDDLGAELVAAISALGFESVVLVDRNDARWRANPSPDEPATLADSDIAPGLLASHEGLTLGDIAPVVGAGLELLGLGTAKGVSEPTEEDSLTVWAPDDGTDTNEDATDAVVLALDATAEAPVVELTAAVTAHRSQSAGAGSDELDETGRTATHLSIVREIDLRDHVVGTQPAGSLVPVARPPRVPQRPTPAPTRVTSSGLRWLGMIGLLVVLGLVIWQCTGSMSFDDADVAGTTQDTAEPDAPDEVAGLQVESTVVPAPTPLPDPTTAPTTEPTAVPTATATPLPAPTVDALAGLPPLESLPDRGAIFRPPTLFLEGPVPTQQQADALYERAVAVVGADNVVNNYVVRPDAPPAIDGNVRVEQAVLFRSGSATISDAFIPTLELGVAVMTLNPQVQMIVEGHTDSVGSEASNLRLSERRAQAVVAYLIDRGVDASRLQAVGLGENKPVASNETAGGRQINRRIEVDLVDLLAGE